MIYLKSSKVNFIFLYALWMKIIILYLLLDVGQFLKGSYFFKLEMLHDLVVKVYYKESLFYIITISTYKKLKYMIISRKLLNFWINTLCCRKRKYYKCKRLIVLLTILICVILYMISLLKLEINKKIIKWILGMCVVNILK
jgi:hypothetical protein